MELSDEFKEKWLESIGPPLPRCGEIDQMIDDSIILQKQRDVFTPKGRLYKVFAMYWHPKGIVFKVDHKREKVITLISAR